MDYRRIWKPGGTYCFTVALLQRNNNALLVEKIDLLRQVVAKVKGRYPFIIHAWVVLADHIHCVIELPPKDQDYPLRWRLIKQGFSKVQPTHEYRSDVRINRGEGVYGNGVIGNTLFAMKPTFMRILIMFTSIH